MTHTSLKCCSQERPWGTATRLRRAIMTEQPQRDIRALQLRRQGFTLDEIAEQCGFSSKGRVSESIKRSMTRMREELGTAVEDLRAFENSKLDYMEQQLNTLLADALRVETNSAVKLELLGKAIERHLKILDKRARLLGLDAPIQIETTDKTFDQVILDMDSGFLGTVIEAEATHGSQESGEDEAGNPHVQA